MRKITVAHSPDADDIFMYFAIKFGWVSIKNSKFINTALDIETLNLEAIKTTYDVSAISFALYPKILEDYALLNTGVSFGNGYGPKLVKKKGVNLKRNFKVALSGENTTNAMLFKIAYPEARIIYKNFLEIENSVLSGEVHAGLLIHESILNFSDELEVEREIWDVWLELNHGENMPLPLGGMVIRRSIPLLRAINIQETLEKAVKLAVSNKQILSNMLLERKEVRIDEVELNKYLSLYANNDSITISEIQQRSINRLFQIGYQHKLYNQIINIQDHMLPVEYRDYRFS